jgi:hypothetical protein
MDFGVCLTLSYYAQAIRKREDRPIEYVGIGSLTDPRHSLILLFQGDQSKARFGTHASKFRFLASLSNCRMGPAHRMGRGAM